jgi:hypothetical protein
MENWNFDEKTGRVTDDKGRDIAFLAGGPSLESLQNGKVIAAAPLLIELLRDSRGGISFSWKQERDGVLLSLGKL